MIWKLCGWILTRSNLRIRLLKVEWFSDWTTVLRSLVRALNILSLVFFLSVYDLRVICILGVLKRNQRFILIDFKDTHITIYSLWPYWSGTLSVLMILQVYCYLLLYSFRFSILWQSVNLELFVCISQRILLSHLLSSRQIYPLVVAFLVNQEWEVLHLVLVVQLLQTKVGSDQFNLTHHINQLIRYYSVMETQLILVRYVYQREK